MKLYPIETGNFKLDGGAMFGVVPKLFGTKRIPDGNNLIDIAARCLLIEDGNQLILLIQEWATSNLKNSLDITHFGAPIL
jgi:hypothetical protein